MAGGQGTRLQPYTYTIPKPLSPVGNLSILEILLRQLKHYGFTKVTLALGYKADLIIASAVGINSHLGLDLSFHEEKEPLGTIGAVKEIYHQKTPPDNFLVLYCDILTVLNFKRLWQYHIEGTSILTIGAIRKLEKIQLGLLDITNMGEVLDLREKPLFHLLSVMGANVFNKKILDYLPPGKFAFDELVHSLLGEKIPIQAFVFSGLWFDLGRPQDWELANATFKKAPEQFLPKQFSKEKQINITGEALFRIDRETKK